MLSFVLSLLYYLGNAPVCIFNADAKSKIAVGFVLRKVDGV